jgi:hypothetical protein
MTTAPKEPKMDSRKLWLAIAIQASATAGLILGFIDSDQYVILTSVNAPSYSFSNAIEHLAKKAK